MQLSIYKGVTQVTIRTARTARKLLSIVLDIKTFRSGASDAVYYEAHKGVLTMKKHAQTIMTIALAAALVLSGCTLFERPAATQAEINDELAELQALIPALEAGLAMATAQEVTLATASAAGRAGIRTINAGALWPDSTQNPTAGDVFTGNGFSVTPTESSGWVRYPYDGSTYLEDFYGTVGNDAEFFVKLYSGTGPTDSSAIFQVKLYIYPTFSTTVNYVLEEYLVGATDPAWALVDETGSADPLHYITNRTVYFDGTVEEHVVVSNSVSTGQYYDTLFSSTDHDDPLDEGYNFPTDPSAAEPTRFAEGTTDAVYSAHVVSTIADTGETVVEYYTEIDDGTGTDAVVKSAISYVTKKYVSGKLEESATTVRRYIEYPDGTKTVRARTESVTSFGPFSTDVKIVTERIDIAENGDGLVTFTSVTTATSGSTTLYTSTVTLTETPDGSGAYAGTSTYTSASGTQTYTVTLDAPASGGGMTVGGKKTSVFYPVSRRQAKDIVAELRHGGTFTGRLKGSVLSGVYKALRSKDPTSVEAALSFIYALTGNQVQLQ